MLLLMVFSAFSTIQLKAEVKNTAIIGEWLYEVSDAPSGYQKGSLIFSEKEGQLICIVKIEAGELEVSNLKLKDQKITFTTYVDGNPINVDLTIEANKMTGKVDSPEGLKTLTAVKKES